MKSATSGIVSCGPGTTGGQPKPSLTVAPPPPLNHTSLWGSFVSLLICSFPLSVVCVILNRDPD